MSEEVMDSAANDVAVEGTIDASEAADIGVPEAGLELFAQNDPDFAEFVKGQTSGNEDNKEADDNSGSDDGVADDNSGDEKEGEQDAEDSADDNSGDDEADEYADDVIKGLSGEEFKKLSPDAQNALAEFYSEVQDKVAEAEAAKQKIDAFMADPIIQVRSKMIENGVTDASIPVRGITPAEKEKIMADIMNAVGLDESEAKSCLDVIEGGINRVINDAARDVAYSMAGKVLSGREAARRVEETAKQGNDILVGLGQFNKALAVKDTNLHNFYRRDGSGKFVLNERHPEIAAFKSGLGRVISWAESQGFSYENIVKMGAQSFYAAAAAALGMPAAFNTSERDKKIATDARKAALKPFLKGKNSGTLNVDGGNVVKKRADAPRIINGMDAVKLAEDGAYYDEMVAKNFGTRGGLEKVEEAANVGRSIIEKRKKN